MTTGGEVTKSFDELPNFDSQIPFLVTKINDHLKTGSLTIFLDIDGTLANFAPTPDKTVVYEDAITAINLFVGIANVKVMAVSGRKYDDLIRLLADVPVAVDLYAGYGAVQRIDGEVVKIKPLSPDVESSFRDLIDYPVVMSESKSDAGGAIWAESKDASVSYHYTDLSGAASPEKRLALTNAAQRFSHSGIEVVEHNGTVEIGYPFNKRGVMQEVLSDSDAKVLQLGDDRGDAQAAELLAQQQRGWFIVVPHPADNGLPGSPMELAQSAFAKASSPQDASKCLLQLAQTLVQ